MKCKLNRYDDSERDIFWRAKNTIVIYENYKVLEETEVDNFDKINSEKVDSFIKISFQKALNLTKKIPNLIYANPISITFCDGQQKCSIANVEFDSLQKIGYLKLTSNKKYAIQNLSNSSKIEELFNDFGYFSVGLKIGSIREYKIGNQTLTVANIGVGQVFGDSKEYKANFKFEKLSESAFEEHLLHHSSSFDFFVLETL